MEGTSSGWTVGRAFGPASSRGTGTSGRAGLATGRGGGAAVAG
ncbi:MAG: hypothetical protein AVDCRST_MAG48-704 [uncultured Friedmanniella sp.]|uniref:Uncharacterized protein n=1 Tax=uncultured Friedmanniella sp. TaxID=335381 RepID=A0A6J4K284_9ACTN|nr:MAG: hypothetical protein AVDCRST_MAG48-704 [uncultured Friedmanniella sp.]